MLLPEDVKVNVCSTDIEITSACDLILESITNDSVLCHVGFDMEWEFSEARFSRKTKRTALIQIARHTTVFLLRVHLLQTLPSSLLTIICSPQIVEIGRNIGGDLAKLSRDFPQYKCPEKVNGKLPGVIELGAFAKSKNAVPKGTASLSAITAAILHANLSKDGRDSPWEAPSLSDKQINYAALD
ncbi:ribonuclease H-like domain-containing protein, partial [Mycena leptocephala]